MQTTNPFPGMNPFLEASWPDVHTALIGFIREALAEELPLDLSARAEEEVIVGSSDDEPEIRYRADVAVSVGEAVLHRGLPGLWQPDSESAIAVAEPEIVEFDLPTERWIEVRETSGRLITVIEVLSPHNKLGKGLFAYLQKRRDYLTAGVNLLEIDLLRMGRPVFPEDIMSLLRPSTGTRYLIGATRAIRPNRIEFYKCPLRERLPAVRVPLRVTDLDVPLDLQPLIDRVYRTGRYWQMSRRDIPAPPLPADDIAWVEERLQHAGLR